MPQTTGIYKFGTDKGEYTFYKLYVSPFDDKDISKYLRRKYPFYQMYKRGKAKQIVERSPNLMVRPMLLANIDDLLQRTEPYEYSYQIYEEMIKRWIQRERIKNKAELRKFSETIAIDMYKNRNERKGVFIDGDEIENFAAQHRIELKTFEMRSRSLLNRNAEGEYKFAHKSILEYFLALEIFNNSEFGNNFDFEKADKFL